MKSDYRVHEIAPDNWAIVCGSRVKIADLTMAQANAVLTVILDAESGAHDAANEAEREAEEARKSEQEEHEKHLAETSKLRAALVMCGDVDEMIDLAAKAQATSDATERFFRDLSNLRNERAGNKAGTRCPPFMRQALDRVLASSGNDLRKLTYIKSEAHHDNPMA